MVNFCICQENSLYLGAYRRNLNNNRLIYGCMYLFFNEKHFWKYQTVFYSFRTFYRNLKFEAILLV